MGFFKCPICGNENKEYIGQLNGKFYCRLCIKYQNCEKEEDDWNFANNFASYSITYNLTNEQKYVAKKIEENINKKINCFVHAVCGAGKTEIVFEIINSYIVKGLKIGFAVPRKDVVMEMYHRFSNVFKNTNIIYVHGNHNDQLYGDLVILTTHQIFRYENYFDLLILDEADAFPFADNFVLHSFFLRSIKGNYIIMSATISNSIIDLTKNAAKLELFRRFHNFDLPIPKIKLSKGIFKLLFILRKLRNYLNSDKAVLIFVSTIRKSRNLWQFLNIFHKNGYYVNSKIEERNKIIDKFKKREFKYLVTTMVLERGITIANLQVIVYESDAEIFNKNALIQISGRVGRKYEYPNGDIYYLASIITDAMTDSIKELETINKKSGGN